MVGETATVMGPIAAGLAFLYLTEVLKGKDAEGVRFFSAATGFLCLVVGVYAAGTYSAGVLQTTLYVLTGWLALMWCVFLGMIGITFFKNAVVKTSSGYSKF